MSERPPRCRPLPPSVVDAVIDAAPSTSRAELVHRLEQALAALPPAERMAVVAAHGYGEGPVGAAVELDIDNGEADALARNALQLLRAALADVDIDD
jgi:DNA-directed RNA polymerase specialized sigma24 family protein